MQLRYSKVFYGTNQMRLEYSKVFYGINQIKNALFYNLMSRIAQ